jgi:16S rRNA C1402 (ribose-2'-O) methylase RsmI
VRRKIGYQSQHRLAESLLVIYETLEDDAVELCREAGRTVLHTRISLQPAPE